MLTRQWCYTQTMMWTITKISSFCIYTSDKRSCKLQSKTYKTQWQPGMSIIKYTAVQILLKIPHQNVPKPGARALINKSHNKSSTNWRRPLGPRCQIGGIVVSLIVQRP